MEPKKQKSLFRFVPFFFHPSQWLTVWSKLTTNSCFVLFFSSSSSSLLMVTLTLTAVPDVPLGDATPTGVVRLHLRDSRPIDKNNKIDEHLRGWANRLNQPWLMGVFLTPGAFHRHRINNAPPHKHHINVRYVRMQPRCHYYSTGCLKLVKKKKEEKPRPHSCPRRRVNEAYTHSSLSV